MLKDNEDKNKQKSKDTKKSKGLSQLSRQFSRKANTVREKLGIGTSKKNENISSSTKNTQSNYVHVNDLHSASLVEYGSLPKKDKNSSSSSRKRADSNNSAYELSTKSSNYTQPQQKSRHSIVGPIIYHSNENSNSPTKNSINLRNFAQEQNSPNIGNALQISQDHQKSKNSVSDSKSSSSKSTSVQGHISNNKPQTLGLNSLQGANSLLSKSHQNSP